MRYLNDEELKSINGGGFSLALVIALGAAIAFIIGLLDGIARPLKCNK